MEIAGISVKLQADSRDLEKGYDKAEQKTKDLERSFDGMNQKTKSAAAGLGRLNTMLAAGVAGAVGAATIGALSSMIQKYGGVANAISLLAGDITKAELAQEQFNRAMNAGAGAAQAEATKLNILLRIARDETRSKEQRQQAIDKINKDYPGYIDNLNLETVNTKKVTGEVDNLTKALVRQARIRATTDLIAKEEQKLADLNTASGIEESLSLWQKLKIVASSAFGGLSSAGESAANSIVANTNEITGNIKFLTEELNKLYDEEADAGTLFVPKPKKVKEYVDKMADQLRTAIQGVSIGAPNLIDVSTLFPVTKLTEELEKALNKSRSALKMLMSETGSTIIDPRLVEEGKRMMEEMEARAQMASEAITGLLQPAFTNLFQTMIDGGQISAQSIGKSMADMAKRILATAAAAAALSAILSGLGLGFGGAKGFKGIFSKILGGGGGIPGFAKGGIISGPTLAMVGEYPGARGNPEVIAPLDKLQSLIGGGGGGTLTATVSGNDLKFILDRTNRSQGRQG